MTASLEERVEMGITHADFRRIFPRITADAANTEGDLERRVAWADGRALTVTVSPEMIRRIALLRLPYVNINFEFQGFSAAQQADFLTRFDRAFHKGGG